MDLARLDRAPGHRLDFISADVQAPPTLSTSFCFSVCFLFCAFCAFLWLILLCVPFCGSLKYRGLRADGEHVPALKCIDGLAWHETHERSLDVERFGRAPVEPHDRIERWRHAS